MYTCTIIWLRVEGYFPTVVFELSLRLHTIYTFIYMCIWCLYVNIHLHTCVYIQSLGYWEMNIFQRSRSWILMESAHHIYIYIYICIYIYTRYICTYTYSYICIYTYNLQGRGRWIFLNDVVFDSVVKCTAYMYICTFDIYTYMYM